MWMETLEYLGIAFVAAWVLILLSKVVLPVFIRKSPQYYAAREKAEEKAMLEAAGIGNAEHVITKPIIGEHYDKPEKPETEPEKKPQQETNPKKPATKKPRKPSMNMLKAELIEMAAERGVELPEKVTKAQIIELIKEKEAE